MDDINTTLQPTRPLVTTAAPLPDTISEGVQAYLAYRAKRGGIINILSNFERLPEELENTWFEEDPKWREPVALLQKRLISYIQPLARHVHTGAPLRLEIHFTKEPPQFSPSPSAVAAVAAIDAKSGQAYHEIGRAEDLEHHPAAQSVLLGLTLACRSVEKGGDFWNMDNNQGGNMYRLEEVEMRENAAWKAARHKSEGLGHPPFIGPAWAPKPLEGQKAMGLGVGGNGALIAAEMPFTNPRANEPMLPHVHFAMPGGARTTGELAAAAGAVVEGRGDEEFFKKQREADAEFNKKQNESAKRWQEQNNEQQKKQREVAEKNKLDGERMALTQRVQADLARVRENIAEISKNPQASEQLAALRVDEAELAGIPGAPPISQIAILNSNLELTDAAQEALDHDRAVTVEAQATAQKDSAEAAGVGTENSAKAAEKISAENFVVTKEAIQASINYYNQISIPQGNRDYTGRLEPVGGPEAPEGGQEREAGDVIAAGGADIGEGDIDAQGRDRGVGGAGIRSAEIEGVDGSINTDGQLVPVGGEVALRDEEPENVRETGVAEAGEIPPATQPQAQPTANEAAEEDGDTRFAEQAQAIVEQEQLRGEAPRAPVVAQGGEGTGSAVDQGQVAPVAATGGQGDASALPEPQQPTQIVTEPASATADRVLEQADAVKRVVGEPVDTTTEQSEPETAQPESVVEQQQGGEGAVTTPTTARDAASLPEPEQRTQIVTEPANATANDVLERADAVKRVVGEPIETNAELQEQEAQGVPAGDKQRGDEGIGTVVPGTATRDSASLPEPQQPTQMVTPPASATADKVLERADTVAHVVGEPGEAGAGETELQPERAQGAAAVAPTRPDEVEAAGVQPTDAAQNVASAPVDARAAADSNSVAQSGTETQAAADGLQQGVQPEGAANQPRQNQVRDRRDAASLPEQETEIETPPASETADQVMHHAEVASHLVPDAAALSSGTVAQNQTAVAGTGNTTPVATPEQEITGQAAANVAGSAAGASPAQSTPREVVTMSPETGEVVSQAAEGKTFADIAAEAPATSAGQENSTVQTDAQQKRPSDDRQTPQQTHAVSKEAEEKQSEEAGNSGQNAHGARGQIAEHLVSSAMAASPPQNAPPQQTNQQAAQTAPPATDKSITPPPAGQSRQAAPATDRSRRAPPATDKSKQTPDVPAELGKQNLPPQAQHMATDRYASLEKKASPKKQTRPAAQRASTKQKQPRRVTKTTIAAPASFKAVEPLPRRKTRLSVAPAKVKRPVEKASVRREAPRKDSRQQNAAIRKALPQSAAAQPRRNRAVEPVSAVKRKAPMNTAANTRVQERLPKQRRRLAVGQHRRVQPVDIKPEPE